MKHPLKIGLFGIGLDTYWDQFEGLKDRLRGYLSVVESKLSEMHPNVVNLGLIDNADKAFEAGSRFRREDVAVIFLYVSTYALSSTVLPVVQRAKVPVAGEYEIKNAQAMKIMDSFGAGGSFTEYYAMDFNDDVVLMGHDGPGHIAIAEGKTKVRPLLAYHGKVGSGLSVEMSVKNGPVTLLSVVETTGGRLKLLVAEAESVPGPILQIGNTNSRYKFPIGARRFVNEWNSYGPAHHCAVGIGHIHSKIEKLGALLNMEVVKVC